MKRALVFVPVFVGIAFMSVPATIINIPDDYSTIQEGINASYDGDTVLVQPRTYVENINFNGHNIVLGSLFLTTGDTTYIAQTIIDGDSSGSVVTFVSGEDRTAVISGFTIRNGWSLQGGGIYCRESGPTISNNLITSNWAFDQYYYLHSEGAGIYCENAWPIITDNAITENETWWFPGGLGGGISCYGDSTPVITGNYIAENQAIVGGGINCEGNAVIIDNWITENVVIEMEWMGAGGGISCINSSAVIAGNTISNNIAGEGGGIWCYMSDISIVNNVINGNIVWFFYFEIAKGGGIYCDSSNPTIMNNTISENTADVSGAGIYCELGSNPIITNTILWNDSAGFNPEIDFDDSSSPFFTYCNIQGGWAGEGNIDTDPLFRDPENGDFHLMADSCGDVYNSPCIDAGDPAIFDSIHGCDWGLGELRSDMGAYGGQAIPTDIREEHPPSLPMACRLLQNYPNPFNSATTLSYTVPQSGPVTLSIYNLLGQRVASIFEGEKQAGRHSITWDAAGFPSGVYFARLEIGDQSQSIKMVFLK